MFHHRSAARILADGERGAWYFFSAALFVLPVAEK